MNECHYDKRMDFFYNRSNADTADECGSISRRKTPMKLMKTVMAVLGAFVVCWTPGLVVLLLDGLNCTRCEVQNVKRWFLLLALLNSVMNPIIYSYKDDEMSNTMRRMICCSFEDRSQERRSSRIPSAVLNRSTDSSSQYFENGISQVTISGKENT
ncbi:lysophosphatidic acid receptor 3 isoform 2-T4 [Liasis olivaceus]